MTDNNETTGAIPIRRRSVLKAGAATVIGAGVFSGTASATEADEIHFCGCSQVCVDREEGKGGNYYVIVAEEDGDGYTFREIRFRGRADFCYEFTEGEKVVALRPGSSEEEVYCNPGRCAEKVINHPDFTSKYTCGTDEFGTFQEIGLVKEDYVDIIRGRCHI